ncbi:hypothetical protein ACWODI_04235 [Facklamia languida]
MPNQWRKLERDLTRGMDKTIKKINKKISKSPINIPVQMDEDIDGLSINNNNIVNNFEYNNSSVNQNFGSNSNANQFVQNNSDVDLDEILNYLKMDITPRELNDVKNILIDIKDKGSSESNLLSRLESVLSKHPKTLGLLSGGIQFILANWDKISTTLNIN